MLPGTRLAEAEHNGEVTSSLVRTRMPGMLPRCLLCQTVHENWRLLGKKQMYGLASGGRDKVMILREVQENEIETREGKELLSVLISVHLGEIWEAYFISVS